MTGFAAVDPGARDEDVDRPDGLRGGLDQGSNRCVIPDIGGDGNRGPAAVGYLRCNPGETVFFSRREDQVATGRGELPGHCSPDASTRAGDERVELTHTVPDGP